MPPRRVSMAEQDLGIILIVLGVVFMVIGVFFLPICGLGLVLLIIGIILAATNRPAQPYYTAPYGAPQPGYAPPGAATQPYPPQPPVAGQPVPGAPFQQPSCYVCGSPLTWVPQYGRWYCSRCQSYR